MFEVPKKALGVGFNMAALPLRARWAAGRLIENATEIYQQQTLSGEELVNAIQLEMPAHNAAIGAENLEKVPKVEKLLQAKEREVDRLTDMDADSVAVNAAVQERRKLLLDIKVLKAAGFGMIGKSVQQVVRNDVPPQIAAETFPPEVETTVLDLAVGSKIKPDKLALPGIDKEIIAKRLDEHQDFM